MVLLRTCPALGEHPIAKVTALVLELLHAQLRRYRVRCDGSRRLCAARLCGDRLQGRRVSAARVQPARDTSSMKIHFTSPSSRTRGPNLRPQPADPRDDLDAELGASPAAPLASADRRHRHYVSRGSRTPTPPPTPERSRGHQLRRRKASAQLVCLY